MPLSHLLQQVLLHLWTQLLERCQHLLHCLHPSRVFLHTPGHLLLLLLLQLLLPPLLLLWQLWLGGPLLLLCCSCSWWCSVSACVPCVGSSQRSSRPHCCTV
jgi:hypothetical protein